MNHRYLAFALARITLGINFLGHGLVRLPKLNAFRAWMEKDFERTLIPGPVVSAFATVLPFIEFALGLFLYHRHLYETITGGLRHTYNDIAFWHLYERSLGLRRFSDAVRAIHRLPVIQSRIQFTSY